MIAMELKRGMTIVDKSYNVIEIETVEIGLGVVVIGKRKQVYENPVEYRTVFCLDETVGVVTY